jgi:UDP-GlcNAc:undecaprenyl-phosphate GlcNAc-1-phosphate transferase
VIPILDFGLAVLRRIGSGKSPFHADQAHLHHRLLSLGHSKRNAVLIMYTWTIVVSVGLLLPLVAPLRTVLIFWVLGMLFAVLLTFDPLRWRTGRHRKDHDARSA